MKKISDLSVAREIKKEYLIQHLDDVKKLIETWLREICVPLPFDKDHRFGWECIYKPVTGLNPDLNHQLRHHLKSRTLWNHHANWLRNLENIYNMIGQIRTNANKLITEMTSAEKSGYTEDYLGMALWKAFALKGKGGFQLEYGVPRSGKGVSLGAYIIETLADTREQRDSVIEGHIKFTDAISRSMGSLQSEYNQVKELESRMERIVSTALTSSNIFYPCKFCRHLWK